jgi:hypothetical protein
MPRSQGWKVRCRTQLKIIVTVPWPARSEGVGKNRGKGMRAGRAKGVDTSWVSVH